MHRLMLRAATVLGLAGLLGACNPRQPSPPPPQPAAGRPEALHNLHRLGPSILSGASPAGDAAFDALAALGVRTVVSVDGATPDVGRAEARGLRYVHIPITYGTITDAQRLEIARAVRDLPGLVYIHCHHGQHRGPAAAAVAAVTLGLVEPPEAVAFMERAGTSAAYAGLYACVAGAAIASVAEMDAAPAEFPAVRRPHGIVAAMVEVERAFEHLGEVRAAGWRVPPDHPDLVPAAEAGRLADGLRLSGEGPAAARHGSGFAALLAGSVERAEALERLIVAGAPGDGLSAAYERVRADCRECHARYRDQH